MHLLHLVQVLNVRWCVYQSCWRVERRHGIIQLVYFGTMVCNIVLNEVISHAVVGCHKHEHQCQFVLSGLVSVRGSGDYRTTLVEFCALAFVFLQLSDVF